MRVGDLVNVDRAGFQALYQGIVGVPDQERGLLPVGLHASRMMRIDRAMLQHCLQGTRPQLRQGFRRRLDPFHSVHDVALARATLLRLHHWEPGQVIAGGSLFEETVTKDCKVLPRIFAASLRPALASSGHL